MTDLKTIRESIKIPPKHFGKETNSWVYYNLANCYQYALSMYIDEMGAFVPGDFHRISEGKEKATSGIYTDEELMYNVKKDLEVLGLEIRESTLEEVIEDENSWKIAVMNVRVISMAVGYDFHFLRQSNAGGEWSQKLRNDQHPETRDNRYKTITNPATASYDFPYELVGYYIISKRNERGEP